MMMMMQAASSFEVLVPVYHFTWRHISEHWHLQKYYTKGKENAK
jgi:hypothetical protein